MKEKYLQLLASKRARYRDVCDDLSLSYRKKASESFIKELADERFQLLSDISFLEAVLEGNTVAPSAELLNLSVRYES